MIHRLRVLNMGSGDWCFEVHHHECRDIERTLTRKMVNGSWRMDVPEGESIRQAVEEDVNDDVAGDYDMTVDEYLAGGRGYRVDDSIKVHACCVRAD